MIRNEQSRADYLCPALRLSFSDLVDCTATFDVKTSSLFRGYKIAVVARDRLVGGVSPGGTVPGRIRQPDMPHYLHRNEQM
jgi:hypothetical protein